MQMLTNFLAEALQDGLELQPNGPKLTRQQLFVKTVTLDPRNSRALYALSQTLTSISEKVEINNTMKTQKELFLEVIDLDDKHPWAYYRLAVGDSDEK